jgi:hypothetical protein
LVAVEGDLVDLGGQSVGVVAEGVLDLAEDVLGWRVGERLGHLARPSLQERTESIQESLDASFAVVGGLVGCGRVGVGHDMLAGGNLLHQQ